MFTRKVFPLVFVLMLGALTACKQELPREVQTEAAFGTVQEMKTAQDEKQLIYQQGADPYTKNWGVAKSYYVTVQDRQYQLHWDQAEKFATLKVGDKVNLHPSEYIACHGESDLKPDCFRLMRIYRSERRISPIKPAN